MANDGKFMHFSVQFSQLFQQILNSFDFCFENVGLSFHALMTEK